MTKLLCFGICKKTNVGVEIMGRKKVPPLMSKADMAKRWGVSRQVVNNWEARHSDFPEPAIWVHDGSLPLYLEEDVMKYEKWRKPMQDTPE